VRGIAAGPAAVLLAALAFALTAWMTFRGPGARIDTSVLDWSKAHRPGWALHWDEWVVWLGSPVVMPTALLLVTLIVARRRRSWELVRSTVTLLVVLTLGVLITKDVFARPGPSGHGPGHPMAVGADSPWAFPSGHATTALVTWTAGARLIVGTRSGGRWAATVVGVLVSVALVTGGYHWLTDVLAAWPFAVLIARLASGLDTSVQRGDRRAARRDSVRAPETPTIRI